MGTPQGGILSPLLANIALAVLDDHFADAWQREGLPRAAVPPVVLEGQRHDAVISAPERYVREVIGFFLNDQSTPEQV